MNEWKEYAEKLIKKIEKVLIKVDWNADEFSDAKQYEETRSILLDALHLPRPDVSKVETNTDLDNHPEAGPA